MSKYDEMSDFEVNSKILNLTAGGLASNLRCHRLKTLNPFGGVVVFDVESEEGATLSGSVDYCSNPADMWPIILKHGLIVDGNGSAISTDENGYQFIIHDKNPLRAAAIVFLMMKDAE